MEKNMEKKLILICWGNMYLSPIQQGIQACHVVCDMFVNVKNKTKLATLEEWAENHKTIYLKNGGYSSNIEKIYDFLQLIDIPSGIFHEEAAALSSAATSVGCIVDTAVVSADIIDMPTSQFIAPLTDEFNYTKMATASNYEKNQWLAELIKTSRYV